MKTIKTVEDNALRGNLRPRRKSAVKRLEGVVEFTAIISAWSSSVDLMRLCRKVRYSVEVTRDAKRAIVKDNTMASMAEIMAAFRVERVSRRPSAPPLPSFQIFGKYG